MTLSAQSLLAVLIYRSAGCKDLIMQMFYEDILSAFLKEWNIALNPWWHKNIDELGLASSVKLSTDIFSKSVKWY